MSLARWKSVREKRLLKFRGRTPFSLDIYKKSSQEKSHHSLFHTHIHSSSATEDIEVKKIQGLIKQIGIELTDPTENIRDVLRGRFAGGDADKAFELLLAHDEAAMGIVKEVDPRIKMLGSENNGKVTCYLDALLFALFARLDCFEAMLYNIFDDEPRRRMSTIIRLCVNLLRTGKLVTSDIVCLLIQAT
jgi:hypothetical protein